MHDKQKALRVAGMLLLLTQAATAMPPTMPPALVYDPANPVILNEFAMQKIRDGDLGAASIMLERAALLAPYDARIQANLTALRDLKAGKPIDTAPNPSARQEGGSFDNTPAVMDMPIAPLWPLK